MPITCPLGHSSTYHRNDDRVYCEGCDTTAWGSDTPHWDIDQCEVTPA